MTHRSPLHDLESACGAEFADHHSWEIVEHYLDPQAEHEAVLRSAGALDLSYLGKLRVSGKDRVTYLHNMLSNDVTRLAAGSGCHAALLTHQGRMESDLFVYSCDSCLWLECPPAGTVRLRETLKKHMVSASVTIADWTDRLCVLSLQGPCSRGLMERTLGVPLDRLRSLEHRPLSGPYESGFAVRRDRTGCDGFDLWLPVEKAAAVWKRWLQEEQIRPVGHRALDWLRTEAGIPWYGTDMDEANLPLEMGLDSAISLSKGCYRGQEIIARIVYRGNLDRRLGGVALDHAAAPQRGAEVRAGGVKIGEVTSAVLSPRLGRPLALSILKTAYLVPGTAVEVCYRESAYPGEVIALPLK